MRIPLDNYKEMLEYFQQSLKSGKGYACCWVQAESHDKNDFYFFETWEEAQEYCYESTTDYDDYSSYDLEMVIERMTNVLNDMSYLDFVIDNIFDANDMIEYQNMLDYQGMADLHKELISDLDNVKKQAEMAGFGDSLNAGINEYYCMQVDSFSLSVPCAYDENARFECHFKLKLVRYQFTDFDLIVNISQGQLTGEYRHSFLVNTDEKVTIPTASGKNYTLDIITSLSAKEAWNLVMGRSVRKPQLIKGENEHHEVTYFWHQLNFAERNNGKGHPLITYPDFDFKPWFIDTIDELKDMADRASLIDSLKHGDRCPVTIDFGNISHQFFMEINPLESCINYYDSKMNKCVFHDLVNSVKGKRPYIAPKSKHTVRAKKKGIGK